MIKNRGEEAQNLAYNWKNFSIFLAISILFFGLSILFLPLIVLKPQKFASFFTIASIFLMIAISILKGHTKFIKTLF